MMIFRDKAQKTKKSRRLSAIMSISFLSVFLTVFIITGIVGIVLAFQTQKNSIFSNQRLIAQNAINTIRAFIEEKFIAMETTARLVNPAVTPGEEQDRIFNHLFGFQPAFRQLILLNSKRQKTTGVSRLSREASEELAGRFENDLFAQGMRGERYIGQVYVDKITSEPMVIMAVPVKDVFGDFQGVLIAEVNLKFMWDLVESIKIGKSGLAYVVDSGGKLIAFGDISRVLRGENIGNLKVVHDFIENPVSVDGATVKEFAGINGRTVLGNYVSLQVPNWAVVTELPVAEAYQTLIQIMVASVGIILIMAVLIGWISIRLARRLSVPLVNLMKTAMRIAGGEIELQAEVSGPTEISNMASAFNSMTARLREVIGRVEQRSRHLEETVRKYVDYMAEVGKGRLNSRLVVEGETDDDGQNTPLVILGRQLNETTSKLQEMIERIQDTTNRLKKHEEKLLIYSDKLRKSNEELEQFAFVASHDLQEPLRKIQFFGERLKTTYSGILDEKALDYIERMYDASVRMGNFIKDLLQYSRVTTKAKPFERVDLNEIIKGVVSDLEIRINEAKAEIRTENLPIIDAEPLQMRQLFQNIIGNAIKYRRGDIHPVVTISSKISNSEDRTFCEIDVTDNGIGFDNKYANQIFGLFQRLKGQSEYDGTGIGLAVCKKIVEQHGGAINASSKEGEGSTFHIRLPLSQKIIE
jgi:signal transduction histidine kinase/HAMP domain-containing protein